MERFTISLAPDLARSFDAFIEARGYSNRSEAVRDLIRDKLGEKDLDSARDGMCVATLSYVYDHHERALATRLMDIHHEHHDLNISTMHVHLDHDSCLETVMLRGTVDRVRTLADTLIAERGVRHGRLNMVPVEVGGEEQGHVHLHPTVAGGTKAPG